MLVSAGLGSAVVPTDDVALLDDRYVSSERGE